MTDLKMIEKTMNDFENNAEEIAKELKRVQSIKCRLKKQKGKSTYVDEMNEVLRYEQVLKEARNLILPKEKTVTTYNQEDIDQLDYDQVVKAIRNIQSKKTLSKWLTTEEGNNEEYKSACVIERMLIEKRNSIRPVNNEHIRKTDLQTVIDTIESSGSLSQEKIVELLKNLI